MNKQEFLAWLATDEGKEVGLPIIDSKVTAGIKTYAEKHPDKLTGRLDEIEKRIELKDSELRQNELKFFAYKKCVESNVDYDLLNGYPLEDEKAINEKIGQLSEKIALSRERLENEIIITNSYKPSGSRQTETGGKKSVNDFILEAEERDRHG